MIRVACLFLIIATIASAQTFDETLPVLILINTTATAPDAQGQEQTTSELEMFGYDDASSGHDGWIFYRDSDSTDPAYDPITDPCSLPFNDTGCSANADCVSYNSTIGVYQCICIAGYEDQSTAAIDPSEQTMPGTICENVDECADIEEACGVGVDQCFDKVGSHECNCTTGYEPNENATFCDDVDECAELTDDCDVNASCNNTEGSHECTCNEGWTGDGITCEDIDECEEGTDDCDENAECSNTEGSFECTCNDGYTGDGVTCEDEDECEESTDNCDIDATCTNTDGSFTCTCNEGYSGDGETCDDIDECDDGTHNCSANAECDNTDGGFTCTCNEGYTGDGETCDDIDECADEPCHANATCTNLEATFSCVCNDGFLGDGEESCVVAEPLEYCYRAILNVTGADDFDMRQSDAENAWRDFLETYIEEDEDQTLFYSSFESNLEAYTDEGTHYSVIVSACFVNITKDEDELTAIMDRLFGSHGVTYGFSDLTVEIGDYNECFHQYDNCSMEATCINLNGSYTCECNPEYYDNSTEIEGPGTNCIDPYSYTCNGTYSTLTLLTAFFTDAGVNVTDIVVSDDCYGEAVGEEYIFTDCGGDDASNDTNIITAYEVLTNTSRLEWIAGDIVNFTYHCVQETEQNLTVDFNATDDFVPLNVFDPASSVGIDINIKQFRNNFRTGSQLQSGSTIKTGDLACVQLELVNAMASGVVVQFKKVDTAKPGSNNNKLEILRDYCSTSKASQFGITTNVNMGDGKFCFTMHRPSSGYRLQVFLTVELCVGDSCTEFSCDNRRRRRSTGGDQSREEELSTVFVIDPDDQCNRDCQRGSCVLDFNRNEQCVCDDNAVKTDEGICVGIVIDDSSDSTVNENIADTSLFIVVGLGVGFLVLAIVVGAFFIARRNRYNPYNDEKAYKN